MLRGMESIMMKSEREDDSVTPRQMELTEKRKRKEKISGEGKGSYDSVGDRYEEDPSLLKRE